MRVCVLSVGPAGDLKFNFNVLNMSVYSAWVCFMHVGAAMLGTDCCTLSATHDSMCTNTVLWMLYSSFQLLHQLSEFHGEV
jgi:hypothetical protein